MTQKQTLTNYQLSLFRKLVLDEVQALLIEGLPRTAEGTIESYAHSAVTVSEVRHFIEGYSTSHKAEAKLLIASLASPGLNEEQWVRFYRIAILDIYTTLNRGFYDLALKVSGLVQLRDKKRVIGYLRSASEYDDAQDLLSEIER